MLYTNTNLNMNVASTEAVTIKLSYGCSCFWLCWHVLHTKIISLSSLILLYIINIIITEQMLLYSHSETCLQNYKVQKDKS